MDRVLRRGYIARGRPPRVGATRLLLRGTYAAAATRRLRCVNHAVTTRLRLRGAYAAAATRRLRDCGYAAPTRLRLRVAYSVALRSWRSNSSRLSISISCTCLPAKCTKSWGGASVDLLRTRILPAEIVARQFT
ncbi:unnamed protein product, partial [Iphiclides podalirius]